ncbi:hypothetical protein T4D_13334 [Trichinella pseudospiralis]|uniref:Uncharacterized protein n=1 Tax=Trichinella pseudospiralis TaxID=6337 RepID=A0A0V1FY10_TRIPS|nr:hypothetical protein T4D_13334 [Trichinella pseudospiralis]
MTDMRNVYHDLIGMQSPTYLLMSFGLILKLQLLMKNAEYFSVAAVWLHPNHFQLCEFVHLLSAMTAGACRISCLGFLNFSIIC